MTTAALDNGDLAFRALLVPADNSVYSGWAADVGLGIARAFGASLTCSHVYAARLHERRFRGPLRSRRPYRHVLFAVFMLFCCFEVAALAAVMILAVWLLNTLQPWAILWANLVAAVVMLGILFRDHHTSLNEVLTSGE